MKVEKIGVIGAGTMGVGIAHMLAEYRFQVVLIDKSGSVLLKARKKLKESVRLLAIVSGSNFSLQEVLEKIQFTTRYGELSECDFFIDNTTEDFVIKKNMYKELSSYITEKAIVAINTSCIPIGRLMHYLPYPNKTIGIHFMNPAPLKKTVEVIKAVHTSKETVFKVEQLLVQLNRKAIIVNDAPGFVINRVFMVTINEAVKTLQERVCENPQKIDDLFIQCLGHKMGPLMTADLIGLDTVLSSLKVLFDEFCDPMYKPAQLLIDMVNRGELGRKAEKGFYTYGMG